jgi:phospholipid N-methyltransferase
MQTRWRVAPLLSLILLFSAFTFSVPAAAQTAPASKDYTPSVGQEGKDVIWVPTPQSLVERMLQMAGTKPTDFVVDLGAGDGRTVITAAKKFGAKALGVEYNPDMVELAKRNAEKEGVSGRAQFIRADIFQTDFSQATVLTLYLLPSLNLKLRPTILNMKPGTRVVSHAFTMDDWQADQVDSSEGRTAYMWIVPAKVGGTWRVEIAGGPRYEAIFQQQFQNFNGSAKADAKPVQLYNGKMRGETITFVVDDGAAKREFTGRVSGEKIEGTAKGAGTETKWTATRIGDAQ